MSDRMIRLSGAGSGFSQRMSIPPSSTEANRPSFLGLTLTLQIFPSCPLKLHAGRLVSRSQRMIFPSQPPEYRDFESGLNATEVTRTLCSFNHLAGFQVRTSHRPMLR